MIYDHFIIGWLIGFTIAQVVYHRDMALKFLATLVLVLASDAAAAQQRTFYGRDGRVIGRAATDTQGTTTYYDRDGRVSARASGGIPDRPGHSIWPGANRTSGPR